VHRDIKPENFVISENTGAVKMIDFGTGREYKNLNGGLMSSYVSTRWYRAPEQVLRSQNYGPQVDIFAVGCVMAEINNCTPLFPGGSELDQLDTIFKVLGTPSKSQWREGHNLAEKKGIEFTQHEKMPMK
jgi:serine/threonine protein kinase